MKLEAYWLIPLVTYVDGPDDPHGASHLMMHKSRPDGQHQNIHMQQCQTMSWLHLELLSRY